AGDRARVVVGTRRGDHVDRVPDAGFGGQEGAKPIECLCAEGRQLEATSFTGIGREYRRAARIADDRDSRTGGYRLQGEELDYVEKLLERIGTNHAGLIEERINGDVQSGERGG